MRNKNLSKLTLSGIFLAISVACLLGASFIPGMELTILLVVSLIVACMIIEGGLKYGIALFAATSVLGFVLVPNKLVLIPYLMFFGIYPIIKYFAEKNPKPVIQIAVKAVYFAIAMCLAYFVLFDLVFGDLNWPQWMPSFLIIPAALVLFVLTDFVLTLLINMYVSRIRTKIGRD